MKKTAKGAALGLAGLFRLTFLQGFVRVCFFPAYYTVLMCTHNILTEVTRNEETNFKLSALLRYAGGLLPAMAFAEDGSTPEKGGSTPEKVSVTFDVNDPDNTILKSVSKRQFSISYSYGSAVTVEPTNSDSYCIWYNGLICEAKDGIVFKEWNTQPDGTGTAYREGETISETLKQDLTLYAIWAQSADISLEKPWNSRMATPQHPGFLTISASPSGACPPTRGRFTQTLMKTGNHPCGPAAKSSLVYSLPG